MIFYGTGELTTGTYSPKAIEYHRSERGKEMYTKWRDLAVEYDPEKAKQYLDEMGVVDKNGDGWREMPSGAELELRIDMSATASPHYFQSNGLVKEDWETVGLKTIINPVPGEQLSTMQQTATYDVRDSWNMGDGPDHLVFPNWLVPIWNGRWAPLYGAWYGVRGTPKEGTELDRDPRDRTPPREEPPADGFMKKMQDLYDLAREEPDDTKRDDVVLDIVQIHIDEGPFYLGTVCNTPTPFVYRNNVGNIPTRQQLGLGGFTSGGTMMYFGIIFPEQFFFKS